MAVRHRIIIDIEHDVIGRSRPCFVKRFVKRFVSSVSAAFGQGRKNREDGHNEWIAIPYRGNKADSEFNEWIRL